MAFRHLGPKEPKGFDFGPRTQDAKRLGPRTLFSIVATPADLRKVEVLFLGNP